MSTKSNKKCQGPSLYKTFLDAFNKAHSNENSSINHRNALIEWNEIKLNEEYVKEKIEEYLEIFNQKTILSINLDKQINNNQEEEEEEEEDKKYYFIKENKVSSSIRYEPLDKEKRQPAQERVYKELNLINEQIVSLIQVKQMGLLTNENRKQLKELIEQKKTKSFQLRRLQQRQRASNKHRNKQRKIIEYLYETKPELRPQLNKLYRRGRGKPRIEEQCPNLLEIIEEIARAGAATDDKRRSDIIRPCLTLDNLREKIKQRGFDIKRSTLYYRLLPHRAKSIDGRRHIYTASVRLRRAQNDEHGKHEDGHFATATIRYIRDLASIFGNNCVLYISQDDKCKVPIGLPAARVQAPMLMHEDFRVHLPDHDWIIAPRHQLIPSVYAICLLSENGDLSYSGPTYIAIRSAKHDLSTADSHLNDFNRFIYLKEFYSITHNDKQQIKPIVILTVDGGPDENPRFPKTLVANIKKFKKYNLDALFVLTHAPGQSAYNIVERRMAPLSHDMAGLILPHDYYGTHLSNSGITTNIDLEKLNFRKAGQILSERWNQTIIDNFSCFAEYINPPITSQDEYQLIQIQIILNEILQKICNDNEFEFEEYEYRIHSSDQYYLENNRSKKKSFYNENKYDIDEYWCSKHVLQSQYTLQIIRCNSIECCGQWRSNYSQIFPHRFLPSPIPFERTIYGIRMADKDHQKGQFYGSLFQRIQFHGLVIQHTKNEMLPFDYCCSSVKKELNKRTCRFCNQYIPSAYRMKNHYKIHAQNYEDFIQEEENENEILSSTSSTIILKKEMLNWLQSDINFN